MNALGPRDHLNGPVYLKWQGLSFLSLSACDRLLLCRIVSSSWQASYVSLPSRQPSPTHLDDTIFAASWLAGNSTASMSTAWMERKTTRTITKTSSPLPGVKSRKLKATVKAAKEHFTVKEEGRKEEGRAESHGQDAFPLLSIWSGPDHLSLHPILSSRNRCRDPQIKKKKQQPTLSKWGASRNLWWFVRLFLQVSYSQSKLWRNCIFIYVFLKRMKIDTMT